MPKKKGDIKRLTPTDKEWIWQTYNVMGKNKSATAKKCGFAYPTIIKVIKEIEEQNAADPKTRESRADTLQDLQNRIQVKADVILDSITDEDLKSGRIVTRDEEGNITAVKEYGPSILQKATSYGIVQDKRRVVFDNEMALRQDEQSGKLLTPQDIAGMDKAILASVERIGIMNVHFRKENPDLATKVDNLALNQEVKEAKAEVINLDDMDG
jgi:transposase-like protein